jgi:hypothetical protein
MQLVFGAKQNYPARFFGNFEPFSHRTRDVSAYSDPTNDFIGMLLTQSMVVAPKPPAVVEDLGPHAGRSLEA